MKKFLLRILIIFTIVLVSVVIFRNFVQADKAKENSSSGQNTQGSNKTATNSRPDFPSYEETMKKQGDSYVVTNPSSLLVLVDKTRELPDNYVPEGLVKPNVPMNAGDKTAHPMLRKEAATAMEQLFKEAKNDGINLYLVSGYRSYQSQEQLFNSYVKKQGRKSAEQYSALPGTSEHQTGLAADVTSKSLLMDLNQTFGDTPEGMWLKDHAHDCGFIISYPKDKTDITGYAYEPWHIRYVGIPQATYMYNHHLTLEEVEKENK